jgi:hypothetical protein
MAKKSKNKQPLETVAETAGKAAPNAHAALKNGSKDKKKTGKQKKAHATRPTPDEEIKIAERQNFIWGLKKSGASVRDIQSVLLARGEEVSLGTIHSDIHAVLRELKDDTTETAENWQTIAKEQCKEYQMALSRIIKNPNSKNLEITEAIKQGNNTIKTLVEIGVIPRPPKVLEIPSLSELAAALGMDEKELPDVNGDDGGSA